MISLDLPTAVATVLKLISEKPEGYKYQDNPLVADRGCLNVLSDLNGNLHPGCLIGSVAIDLGIAPNVITFRDMNASDSSTLFMGLKDYIDSTTAARVYLSRVQYLQDTRHTWADSHIEALERTLNHDEHLLTDAEREWLGDRSL